VAKKKDGFVDFLCARAMRGFGCRGFRSVDAVRSCFVREGLKVLEAALGELWWHWLKTSLYTLSVKAGWFGPRVLL
jgi:hypothetical protein